MLAPAAVVNYRMRDVAEINGNFYLWQRWRWGRRVARMLVPHIRICGNLYSDDAEQKLVGRPAD
uniref:Uncharacterized protein n=1 Tax=Romanomermis culicivorax TaxID=13658 RepID=A0A915KX79_ROMCU